MLLLSAPVTSPAHYWNDFEDAPHNYFSADLKDPISLLIKRVESGESKLDEATGKPLVDRLLKELELPVSSQPLVFTQTSLLAENRQPGQPAGDVLQ